MAVLDEKSVIDTSVSPAVFSTFVVLQEVVVRGFFKAEFSNIVHVDSELL